MKEKALAGLAAGFFLFAMTGMAWAIPATIVDIESEWKYALVGQDLWSNWNNAGYSSFDWDNAAWSTGKAAFGNAYSHGGFVVNPPHTNWAADTDLALTKEITIDGPIGSSVFGLNVASDNGFIVFVNGQQVAKFSAEGFTWYWEYRLLIDSSYFNPGVNTVSVLAEDHGGLTYFDMKLTRDGVNPIPEPATVLLFGTGLAGIASTSLRRKKTV